MSSLPQLKAAIRDELFATDQIQATLVTLHQQVDELIELHAPLAEESSSIHIETMQVALEKMIEDGLNFTAAITTFREHAKQYMSKL